jgi:hypothetical protein
MEYSLLPTFQLNTKIDKTFVNEELLLAVDELRLHSISGTWFISVLFFECNVPAISIGGGQTLLDFQWFDLYTDWSSGILHLLMMLKADEIDHFKELTDEYSHKCHNHLARSNGPDPLFGYENSPVDRYRELYLLTVRGPKDKFGVSYDRI